MKRYFLFFDIACFERYCVYAEDEAEAEKKGWECFYKDYGEKAKDLVNYVDVRGGRDVD